MARGRIGPAHQGPRRRCGKNLAQGVAIDPCGADGDPRELTIDFGLVIGPHREQWSFSVNGVIAGAAQRQTVAGGGCRAVVTEIATAAANQVGQTGTARHATGVKHSTPRRVECAAARDGDVAARGDVDRVGRASGQHDRVGARAAAVDGLGNRQVAHLGADGHRTRGCDAIHPARAAKGERAVVDVTQRRHISGRQRTHAVANVAQVEAAVLQQQTAHRDRVGRQRGVAAEHHRAVGIQGNGGVDGQVFAMQRQITCVQVRPAIHACVVRQVTSVTQHKSCAIGIAHAGIAANGRAQKSST